MRERKCFIIIRENTFYLLTDKSKSISECNFVKIKHIPGVYNFANLYEDLVVNSKKLKKLLVENKILSKHKLFGRNKLREIFVAIPDDVQPIEKRLLEEFLFITISNGVKVRFTFENMIVNIEDKNYICVYKTCRMVAITYISNKEVIAQLLLERKDYSVDELKDFVYNIHYDVKNNNFNVYLIGNDMEKYSVIGKAISYDKILYNFARLNTNNVYEKDESYE